VFGESGRQMFELAREVLVDKEDFHKQAQHNNT
jgi:hypothetical protein